MTNSRRTITSRECSWKERLAPNKGIYYSVRLTGDRDCFSKSLLQTNVLENVSITTGNPQGLQNLVRM